LATFFPLPPLFLAFPDLPHPVFSDYVTKLDLRPMDLHQQELIQDAESEGDALPRLWSGARRCISFLDGLQNRIDEFTSGHNALASNGRGIPEGEKAKWTDTPSTQVKGSTAESKAYVEEDAHDIEHDEAEDCAFDLCASCCVDSGNSVQWCPRHTPREYEEARNDDRGFDDDDRYFGGRGGGFRRW
jgi:hypothetical protein